MIRIEIKYEPHEDGSAHINLDIIKGVDTVETERLIAVMLRKQFEEFAEEAGVQTEITEEI